MAKVNIGKYQKTEQEEKVDEKEDVEGDGEHSYSIARTEPRLNERPASGSVGLQRTVCEN